VAFFAPPRARIILNPTVDRSISNAKHHKKFKASMPNPTTVDRMIAAHLPFAFRSRVREDSAMKRLAIIAAGGLLAGGSVFAEPRVFTNAEGKTLKAPCFSAIDDKVVCKLKPMDVTLAFAYTIFNRVSISGKAGSKTKLDEFSGEVNFETETIRCEDRSRAGWNLPRGYKSEAILDVIFELSQGGHDFHRQSAPGNLADQLEENDT
jgi:hypothetical protein